MLKLNFWIQNRNLNFIRKSIKIFQNQKFSNLIQIRKISVTMPNNNSRIEEEEKFNFDKYDVIGFDLDGTLLRYNLDEMVPLEFNSINKYLVDKFQYPKEILQPLENFDFLQKGLILDTKRGNVLKINSSGKVLKCSHGTRQLNESEIIEYYGPEKYWDVGVEYIKNPLAVWNGPISQKIRACLDYFDMPASLVFATIVDIIDSKNQKTKDYDIYKDILEAIVHLYTRDHFAEGCSDYFQALKSDPSRYISKASPKLISWLEELKKTKAIYLLTGSNIDFANLTAGYAFGPKWTELFDVVVTFAKKPGFFTENRSFYNVENLKETEKIDANALKLNEIYSQGNWKGLQLLLAKKFNKNPLDLKSLYVGDNLIQDVFTPNQYCKMDTVCICEELGENVDKSEMVNFKNIISSKRWSSYFTSKNELTYWSEIMMRNSKLCVFSIDEICKHPLSYNFNAMNLKKKLKEDS